jgi:hypothetical protein
VGRKILPFLGEPAHLWMLHFTSGSTQLVIQISILLSSILSFSWPKWVTTSLSISNIQNHQSVKNGFVFTCST